MMTISHGVFPFAEHLLPEKIDESNDSKLDPEEQKTERSIYTALKLNATIRIHSSEVRSILEILRNMLLSGIQNWLQFLGR